MKSSDSAPFTQASKWNEKWGEIFEHYQNDTRHSHYIHALLKRHERKVLEIGAGSFRDMATLRAKGINCKGIDFSKESIALARKHFPDHIDCIHEMSAFDMKFANREFDVSYHNGLWGYFSDDQIDLLAKEQARVTGSRMMATVHNAHNKQFVEYFEKLKPEDPLYDIRFFNLDEITGLMGKYCDEIVVIPVGKGKKRHEDWLIKHGVTNPTIINAYLKATKKFTLAESERLICIGHVNHAKHPAS